MPLLGTVEYVDEATAGELTIFFALCQRFLYFPNERHNNMSVTGGTVVPKAWTIFLKTVPKEFQRGSKIVPNAWNRPVLVREIKLLKETRGLTVPIVWNHGSSSSTHLLLLRRGLLHLDFLLHFFAFSIVWDGLLCPSLDRFYGIIERPRLRTPSLLVVEDRLGLSSGDQGLASSK